ncbi:MAG: sigma-54-dependent Fis family transcriptional regulator [Planctomycetaceae bacterium]|nr:sigma-54-dependent Fis family transcriptional regulator [Planctomycetaceae bacterium]MBV8311653.1 sigma-54-dependent Fis family transcriptional regulator [Planctomycetaceae bacterium]
MHDVSMVLISQDSTLASVVQEVVARTPGIRLERVQDHDEAYDRVANHGAALILSHLTPAGPVAGLTRLLSTLEARGRGVPVLVLSDEYHAKQALALHRLGVTDYLSRPLDLGRLGYLIDILTLARRLGAARPESVAPNPQPQLAVIPGDESFFFLGRMGEMIEQIRRIAPQDTTILLGGETGSGKTRLAGVIHRLSPRRDKPLLTVNCGALAANLIESEMFGHVRGAFTGADTNRVGKFTEVGRGTLFLDEIDSLPPVLQAKLLRAVEDRVFEPVGSNKTQPLQARLISASNRPLDQEVASGRFRADLYYRLNVVAFNLPPLRERVEGIPQLATAFLAEFGRRAGRLGLTIAPEAIRALQAHSWPGNIRELRNVIERAVALSDGPTIQIEDLPDAFHDPGPAITLKLEPSLTRPTLAASKDEVERVQITAALERNGNNRLRAAAELGISRMTLYKKLHKLGLMAS